MKKEPRNITVPGWMIWLYIVCLVFHFTGCVVIPYPWDIVAIGPMLLFSVFMVCVVVWVLMEKD